MKIGPTLRRAKRNLYGSLPWYWWGPFWKLLHKSEFRRQRFLRRNLGKNCYVDPTVQVFGYENFYIGNQSAISEECLVNVNSRNGIADQIRIGSNCHIGRRNYFSSGGLIECKDYVLTGLDCHFLGCGHDIESPFMPYSTSGLTAGAPIVIGSNCWLTTSVTVLEGVTIGRGSVIGARSVVTTEIPPFSVAIGSPARVVKRFDFKNRKWTPIGDWREGLEAYFPSDEEYISELLRVHPRSELSIHASSRRFGWLP